MCRRSLHAEMRSLTDSTNATNSSHALARGPSGRNGYRNLDLDPYHYPYPYPYLAGDVHGVRAPLNGQWPPTSATLTKARKWLAGSRPRIFHKKPEISDDLRLPPMQITAGSLVASFYDL